MSLKKKSKKSKRSDDSHSKLQHTTIPCYFGLVPDHEYSKLVSKLVFYAQSTGAVISGRYISHIVYLIFNNVYVLKLSLIHI